MKRRIMMGGMFVGMLLLHLVIFILIVLLWIYRKPLAESAARDKAMADRERKRNPRLKKPALCVGGDDQFHGSAGFRYVF